MDFVHGADGWRQYTDVTTRETYPDQVTLADVQAAADCLYGVAVRTPLLAFGDFDDEFGATRVWLKPENLQPIGAFKIRVGKVNGHDEDQWPGRRPGPPVPQPGP